MSGTGAEEWDAAALSFDDEPDHGLRDPEMRAAWGRLLLRHLPKAPSTVLDLGCGTGTLSVLLASLGFSVTGVDSSSAMVAQAIAKAAREGQPVAYLVGDAACPPVSGPFDVLLCRHLLWALPETEKVLERWRSLIRPDGRLVLIEGLWSTGAGIEATDLTATVERAVGRTTLERLTDEGLWGRTISDERYLIAAVA